MYEEVVKKCPAPAEDYLTRTCPTVVLLQEPPYLKIHKLCEKILSGYDKTSTDTLVLSTEDQYYMRESGKFYFVKVSVKWMEWTSVSAPPSSDSLTSGSHSLVLVLGDKPCSTYRA